MFFIYIADFIYPTVRGGAEHNDKEMLLYLKNKGHSLTIVDSLSVSIDFLSKIEKKCKLIVSNFGLLHQDCIKYIQENFDYIIYEHDHKYLLSRNPGKFKDFIVPKDEILNLEFYQKAKRVFCQSNFHKEIIEKNLNINNIFNISGNFWSDEDLEFIKKLSLKDKKECCSIIYSNNAHKNYNDAIKYCEHKNLSYNVISHPDYRTFLEKMSENECLLFLPKVPETLSRIVVECRMMNMKVITNSLVGARSESWFSLKGEELIQYMKNRKAEIICQIEQAFS